MLITVSGIVFIAPFFILSALGGELADRYDKAFVAQRIRLCEIPIAALAATGFFLHSVPILFVALGLFGVVAALFGPVKYGILPEKLQTAELPAGNALVEGATFLAILIGTIAGGVAVATRRQRRDRRRHHPGAGAGLVVVRPAHPDRRSRRAWPRHHGQSVGVDDGAAARAASPTRACGAERRSYRGSGWSASWCCRCCRRSSRRWSAAAKAW